jgi:hypothetical protein
MVTWQKLGRIFDPNSSPRHPKLISHAANPLPVRLEGDIYRVFFSARDKSNRSSVGAFDFDLRRRAVVREYFEPVFLHGPSGSYFAEGVSLANCYRIADRTYMLFMGWQRPSDGHWRGDIGRLNLNSDFSLTLFDNDPLLGTSAKDPISLSYPWVIDDGAQGYKMWYGSTLKWESDGQEMVHVLNLATSHDGHHWTRQGLSVPYDLGRAQAFSRPTVHKDSSGNMEMWFSYRGALGQSYRIGHAFTDERGSWQLDIGEVGIDVSSAGWDSEMIEYPFVLDHDSQRYMFYNGNDYGRSGIGLALLDHA